MELYHLGLTLSIARVCRIVGDKFSAPAGHGGPHLLVLAQRDHQVLVAAVLVSPVWVPLPVLLVLDDTHTILRDLQPRV